MLTSCLLQDIGLIQTIEQNRLESFALEDLRFVFASYEDRDGVFGEVELRL
jgi:hypothetical protein